MCLRAYCLTCGVVSVSGGDTDEDDDDDDAEHAIADDNDGNTIGKT